jgi:hypothetical protein
MSGPPAHVTFSTVWKSALPRSRSSSPSEVRQAGVDRRLEQPFATPGRRAERDDRAGEPTNGSAQKTPARDEIRADHQRAPLQPVDRAARASARRRRSAGRARRGARDPASRVASSPRRRPSARSSRATCRAADPSVARNSSRKLRFGAGARVAHRGARRLLRRGPRDRCSSASARSRSRRRPDVTRIALRSPKRRAAGRSRPRASSASKTARRPPGVRVDEVGDGRARRRRSPHARACADTRPLGGALRAPARQLRSSPRLASARPARRRDVERARTLPISRDDVRRAIP